MGSLARWCSPTRCRRSFPASCCLPSRQPTRSTAHRRAGVHAHNRWLVDWCGEFPQRRAGVGQIFLNDVDDAIEDVRWIKEHGLRGGILLPNIAPDVKWVKPLYDPCYDPLWEVIQDLDVPINVHSGTGNPDYGSYPTSMLLYINEVVFYTERPLVQMILSGVFERFPRLRMVITEAGCAWVPPLLERLDVLIRGVRDAGAIGEIRYGKDQVLTRDATEYFEQNVWMGVSQPKADDIEARHQIGLHKFMWGSDYPHDEGTYPYTRENLRARFGGVAEADVRQMLAGNAAEFYDFDLAAMDRLAARVGPTVAEIAVPLDEVPNKHLERLSDDMDAQAIK